MSFQAYIDNVASKTGKTPEDFPKLAERKGLLRPGVKAGEITRSHYQEAVGGDLASRTAIHDLQDLVKRGLLIMVGRGPATRYLLASSRANSR